MEILQEYVIPVILATCMSIGWILKNAVKTEKINRFIPLIMGVLGVCLNAWVNLSFSPEILLGGLASGLASTGMYEAVRHLKKGGE